MAALRRIALRPIRWVRNRPWLASLRARLIAVAVVALLPALAFVLLYANPEERDLQATEVRSEALRLAQDGASRVDRLLQGSHQLLVTASGLVPIGTLDERRCNRMLGQVLTRDPRYGDLGVIDPSGDIRCSAERQGLGFNVAGVDWFEKAVRARRFTVSGYQLSGPSGEPVVVTAYPVVTGGDVRSVVYATLALDQMSRVIARSDPGEGTTVTVVDGRGTVLARSHAQAEWVGRSLRRQPVVRSVLQEGEQVDDVTGPGGDARLYASTPVERAPADSMFVMERFSEAAILGRFGPDPLRETALLALVALLAVVLALAGGEYLVVRRIRRLVEATRRLAEGDLSARSGAAEGRGELARLARSFDEMAASLERRDAELKRTAEDHRRLLAHLVQAQEEERRRIASDVHDDSIQAMTAVGLRLGTLRQLAQDSAERATLAQLEETVRTATTRLRDLLFQLRPPALERSGLVDTVESYAQRLDWGRDVEVRVASDLDRDLPAETGAIAFRIVQEALTNARKHAAPTHVEVALGERAGGLWVRVRDDGRGFPLDLAAEPRPGHMGLTGTRERAEIAGGWWKVDSEHGAGTSVEFWLPLADGGANGAAARDAGPAHAPREAGLRR